MEALLFAGLIVLRLLSFLGLGVAFTGMGRICGPAMRAGEMPAAAEE